MYVETYYKFLCPKCNVFNWLCDGNTADCSGVDLSPDCKCWTIFEWREREPYDNEEPENGMGPPV